MSDAKPADAAPAAKGGKKKLLILLAAAVLLLAVAGGAAAFYLKHKHAAEAADEDEAGAQVHGPAKKKAKAPDHPPVFVPLENFIVNLADREADRYLQLGVTLQVEDAKVGEQIKSYLPAIRNHILLLLSRKTAQDLAGPEGKERLALEVRAAAVRGMGIEVDDEDLLSPQEGASSAKKSKRRRDPTLDWPVEAVQFSSLLIQ